jgi:uncharacterized protein with HEPN domain
VTRSTAAKYLWDARQAVERIVRFTAGRNYSEYSADDMLRAAVERQFEIIGEALGGFRRVDPDAAQTVVHLPRIVSLRNVLIHGYATVDDRLVWGIIEADLVALGETLDRLLAAKS